MTLYTVLKKISDFSYLVSKKKSQKQIRKKIKEQVKGLKELEEIQF